MCCYDGGEILYASDSAKRTVSEQIQPFEDIRRYCMPCHAKDFHLVILKEAIRDDQRGLGSDLESSRDPDPSFASGGLGPGSEPLWPVTRPSEL
jgi:hypothetical protein